MKIHQQTDTKPYVTVVACQHGNEPFGREIIEALKPHIEILPGLQLIVANEEALAINERGVDGDLNRSYPGLATGHHEERLAGNILRAVRNTRYLLDVHTSVSSCGFLVPIVANLNSDTRTVLNLLDANRIVEVKEPLADCSLIGNVPCGVSLEFQKDLAGQRAIDLTVNLVQALFQRLKQPPVTREVFHVTDILGPEVALPETARDFEYVPDLDLYPVLLKDPAYMGNQGLKATSATKITI